MFPLFLYLSETEHAFLRVGEQGEFFPRQLTVTRRKAVLIILMTSKSYYIFIIKHRESCFEFSVMIQEAQLFWRKKSH